MGLNKRAGERVFDPEGTPRCPRCGCIVRAAGWCSECSSVFTHLNRTRKIDARSIAAMGEYNGLAPRCMPQLYPGHVSPVEMARVNPGWG